MPNSLDMTNRVETQFVEKHALEYISHQFGCWFVGHAVPCKESLGRAHRERQGFRILSMQPHVYKVEAIKVEASSRYLFINLDRTWEGWRSIEGTVGMASLTTAREIRRPVTVGLVADLQEAVWANDFIQHEPNLAPRDAVRLTDSPFTGQAGDLLRFSTNRRVEMLLDLLIGPVRRKLAWDFLKSVTRRDRRGIGSSIRWVKRSRHPDGRSMDGGDFAVASAV